MTDNISISQKNTNEDLFRALRSYEKELESRPDDARLKSKISLIKDQIVNQNQGLVGKFVGRRFYDRIDEMQSETGLAITRAMRCFDVKRGNKWCTYLSWALKRAVWHANKVVNRDLTKTAGIKTIGFDDRLDIQEEEKDLPHEDVVLIPQILREAGLDKRELGVIDLRFFKKQPLRVAAERYGISRERVRQVELIALKKLRAAYLRIKGFDDNDRERLLDAIADAGEEDLGLLLMAG